MTIVAVTLLSLLLAVLMWLYLSAPKLPVETDGIIDDVLNSPLPDVVSGRTGFATSDGLKIWYESIPPTGPPKGTVLLIFGMAGDALIWPPKFVQAFVEAGYRVVRYDNRGTGMSDWVENWDPDNPYSVADMARDALAVLDVLEISEAHLVGLSLGGMIAQEVGIQRPDKVASLTLMLTSGDVGDPELPHMSTRAFLRPMLQGIALLIRYYMFGGERNLIKTRIAKIIMVNGYEGLDIREIAEVVLYDLRNRRGLNVKAGRQHQVAAGVSSARYEGLRALRAPALVIHGTADDMLPFEHGKKLAATLPHAKGLWLEGVGHVFPLPKMDEINKKIVAHMSSANDVQCWHTNLCQSCC